MSTSSDSDKEGKALYKLTKVTGKDVWKCGPCTTSALSDSDLTFARFMADGNGISFQWLGNSSTSDIRKKLIDHFLLITAKDKMRVVALREPESSSPISLDFSGKPTSQYYSLSRFGVPSDAVYAVKLLHVKNTAGNLLDMDAIQSLDNPDSKGRKCCLKVGTPQPACFTVFLEQSSRTGGNPCRLRVQAEYKGILLEHRSIWQGTAFGKAKLAGLEANAPVPLFPQDITTFLRDCARKKADLERTKKENHDKASAEEIKQLSETIMVLDKEFNSNFSPVEQFANELKDEFSKLDNMMLQYQICVKLRDQQVVLCLSK